MKTFLILTALVLSPTILFFGVVFGSAMMMIGHEESDHPVYTSEDFTEAPDGSHVAVMRRGHYEPYAIGATPFTEIWISRNRSIAAPAAKVYDGFSQISWADDSHLTITLDEPYRGGTSLHEANGIGVSYRLSERLHDKYFTYFTLDANSDIEEKRTASSIALPSYYEFRKWARENTDNAE